MANKEPVAIELQDISSYPIIEESKEERKESHPEEYPSLQTIPNSAGVNRQSHNPQILTPIVAISTNPPPMSFVEQQRLRAQQPRPAERTDYPNLPPQPERSQFSNNLNYVPPVQQPPPMFYNSMLTIACSGCRGLIQYPANAPIVYCLQCRATTATKPLLNIVCNFCRNSAYYSTENPYIRCRCGTVYSIRAE